MLLFGSVRETRCAHALTHTCKSALLSCNSFVSVPPRALSPARNCTALGRAAAACVKSAREVRGAASLGPGCDPHSASHSQTLSRARRPHRAHSRLISLTLLYPRETNRVPNSTSASANFSHEFPEHLPRRDCLRVNGLTLHRYVYLLLQYIMICSFRRRS